jgi:hypothetical protein
VTFTYQGQRNCATAEYQICFKCHSNYNTAVPATIPAADTTPTTWAGEELGWGNVAQEFNPKNGSAHPVVANTGSGMANNRASISSSAIKAPWNSNVGNQTMYCSDCHGNDDTAATYAQGPHASAVKFMLKPNPSTPGNKYWPYKSDGTTLWSLRDSNFSGLFCNNCHNIGSYDNSRHSGWKGESTSRHPSNRSYCVSCHIRVPHGGKVPRLVVTANAPARYKVGGVTLNFGAYDTDGGFTDAGGCSQHSSGSTAW